MSGEKSMEYYVLKTVLETPSLYQIISAVRGPDIFGDNLKWLFTCRLRALIARTCPGNVRTSPKVDFSLVMEAYREAWNAYMKGVDVEHFLGHTYEALVQLGGFDEITGEAFRETYELRILAFTFMELLSHHTPPLEAEEHLKVVYDRFEVIKLEGNAGEKAD